MNEVVVGRNFSFLFATFLALGSSSPVFASVSDLNVGIQAPVPPTLGRPFQLAVDLRNGGGSALSLPNGSTWSEPHGLSLEVSQVNGSSRVIGPESDPAVESVKLAPGDAVVVFRTLDASDVFFAGAGDYLLTVTYTGPEGSAASVPLLLSVH